MNFVKRILDAKNFIKIKSDLSAPRYDSGIPVKARSDSSKPLLTKLLKDVS
jgi:hypothetical protein